MKIETRLYSYFEKEDGKWIRKSNLSFKKSTAVRFFQNRLLNSFFSGVESGLRPLKKEEV